MHRLMVLSSAYQMSSASNERAMLADPGNRLLWRMPRRRLDAESLRDALLAVSGRLDRTIGGGESGEFLFGAGEVIDKNRDFFRPNQVKADHPYYTNSVRRSLYLPVVRNSLPDVLALFDAADPNGVTAVRNDTTVPSQALFLMNHPFVRQQALHCAQSLLADAGMQDEGRVRAAFLRVLGRPPAASELHDALEFVQKYVSQSRTKSHVAAWQSYCQMLFCSNEFLYVE
jgi:cobalamin biosynthesis Mg chelatase CobN